MHGEPRPSRDEATAICERIIAEIPPEIFSDITVGFPDINWYEEELNDGDPLLYR